MTFKVGAKKLLGSGRKRGTPNKRTELARAGVESAIETCRTGGMTPIQIMMESARFLRGLAAMRTPTQQDLMRTMDRAELEFVVDLLVKSADIASKAANYAFPKLAQVDYVGDIPQGPSAVENKLVFVLNIDDEQPGRPVSGPGGNGHVERPSAIKFEERNR